MWVEVILAGERMLIYDTLFRFCSGSGLPAASLVDAGGQQVHTSLPFYIPQSLISKLEQDLKGHSIGENGGAPPFGEHRLPKYNEK